MAEVFGLEVLDLVAKYDGNQVVHGLSFTVQPSEFVTLLGPSGCGKSTTLRCVAGLHRTESGRITIGGNVVADENVHVRPEHRQVNMVFQSYAVWPHMTVRENVGYGLRMAKVPKAEIARRVDEILEMVGLAEFASRSATGLSGGQQQRVALARALATKPKLLLLDEPLSNLDTVLRARMRSEILRIQRETGTTTLYVTHDCAEALSMSDRIAILDRGRIVQLGTPLELYDQPVNRFVARFLGSANFVTAEVVDVRGDESVLICPALESTPQFVMKNGIGSRVLHKAMQIDLVIRPERLSLKPVDGKNINSFPARVVRRDFLGSKSEVVFRSGEMELVVDVPRGSYSQLSDENVQLFVDSNDLTWVHREEQGEQPAVAS